MVHHKIKSLGQLRHFSGHAYLMEIFVFYSRAEVSSCIFAVLLRYLA